MKKKPTIIFSVNWIIISMIIPFILGIIFQVIYKQTMGNTSIFPVFNYLFLIGYSVLYGMKYNDKNLCLGTYPFIVVFFHWTVPLVLVGNYPVFFLIAYFLYLIVSNVWYILPALFFGRYITSKISLFEKEKMS